MKQFNLKRKKIKLALNLFKNREKQSNRPSKSILTKLRRGLSKTRKILTTDINELFSSGRKSDEDIFERLEEILISSDFGVEITMDIMEKISKKIKKKSSPEELKHTLKKELIALFPKKSGPPKESDPTDSHQIKKPYVIMVIGVNGTGKTTTLGKLAMKYTSAGKKVLIAAADTFRAAAIEQVEIWADRSNASIVKHRQGADPAAVAFDGVEASIARNVDVLLIDTAGRLHTQKNLMEELKKIKRSVGKRLKGAPHEILMVLDATTGQNAISQAKMFNEAVGITALALTKLDGTAKGGIVASIANSMNLPLKYIGVGEKIEDIEDFNAELFINALFD